MSTFKVGQRVRIKYMRNHFWGFLSGREGTVIAAGSFKAGDDYWLDGDYHVQVDGDAGCPARVLADQLEPIVPPHEASQYSYTELMDRLKAGEVECV